MRPDRPWPYWYEVRIEYKGLFRARPKLWWRDMFLLPFNIWRSQRAERSLFEVISPEELIEALSHRRYDDLFRHNPDA